jgi:PPOX class probable F420-dependent enzyme
LATSAALDPAQPKDAHILERLGRDIIVWIVSVRPDGRPHTVPVWFLWEDGGTLLMFSKPDQKIRNLRDNPAVVIALDNTNNGHDVVLFEGTAELLEEGSMPSLTPAYAAKYQPLMDPYNWTAESMAAEYRQPIRITPTRWLFR